ncbi:hypothetical protein TIFTF001_039948 [Ficus carica]|uniref:WW domain-containing protein n=1 Tax=Ficus carica TaxID=3494 RepID=A0AA88CJZ4_FICCA|nr:hypothetical protein TIFTF001_039947 [Ficus carica]GMN20569.1 hypothetical protein TIFTF001_039948 [Ficus carica]
MELPELSLAPTHAVHVNKNSKGLALDYSDTNASRKRKLFQDHLLMKTHEPALQASVDLQLKDPLPLDWEQCLDLESGKMYYLNRKTLRKSWNWPIPMEQTAAALDLELNISTFTDDHRNYDPMKKQNFSAAGNTPSNMVALACLNCHLLVILSKSSPSCPNCKYVHSLPTYQNSSISSPPPKVAAVKPLNTLSLLN